MAWVTPVTNRTGGHYTYDDLNRVGGDMRYLADLLVSYGYTVTVTAKSDWTAGGVPRSADMVTYIADLEALKSAFYGTTALPEGMERIDYRDANNIEKLLEEIETYINRMVAGFRKCGTFKSGQGVVLP